jgi:hypothetical protein
MKIKSYFLLTLTLSLIATINSCNDACLTCPDGTTQNTECTTCKEDSQFYSIVGNPNACYSKDTLPSSNYYLDSKTWTQCDISCLTCSGGISTNCLTCDKNKQLYKVSGNDNSCFTKATLPSANYYLDDTVDPGIWKQCNSSCLTCSGSAGTNCLTCDNTKSMYIYNKSCAFKANSPSKFYFDTAESKFKNCHTTCDVCSELGTTADNKCEKCLDNTWSVPKTNNCIDPNTSIDRYTYDTDKWVECYPSCKACNGVGDTSNHKCTGETCISADFIWFKSDDKTSCLGKTSPPNGYFYDMTINANAFTACHSNCATCSKTGTDSAQNCFTCKNNDQKVLTNDGKNNCYDITGAAPVVPSDYTWKADKFVYNNSNCYTSCHTCIAPGDASNHNCLTCKYNFFPLSTDTKQCFDKKAGSYIVPATNKWKQCDASCSTCLNETSCETCANGKLKDSNNKLCTSTCSDGYFKDTTDNSCKPCIHPCVTCEAKDSCLSCPVTYILTTGAIKKCFKNCMNNQFSDAIGSCFDCPSRCATCEDGFTCKTCTNGYFLFTDNCIKDCPAGFYLFTNTDGSKQCNPCDSVCSECNDGTKACKCKEGFFTSDGICMNSCPAGQYPDNLGKCLSCVQQGKVVLGDNCIGQCPIGYISDNGFCKTCLIAGKYLYNNECISKCPDSYEYNSNNVCYPNNVPLIPRITSELTMMTECNPQPCLNQGACTTSYKGGHNTVFCKCPDGFYGRRCEYDYKANEERPIQDTKWIRDAPLVITDGIYNQLMHDTGNSISLIIDKYLSAGQTGFIDEKVLDYTDTALFANIYKEYADNTNRAKYFDKLQEVKTKLNDYIDIITHSNEFGADIKEQKRLLYKFSTFSLELSTTMKSSSRLLQEENLMNTYIDYTKCEELIRSENRIANETAIVIKKLEYSSKTFSDDIILSPAYSDYSVSLAFSADKQKLDTKNCTGDSAIIYSLPIRNTTLINLDLYQLVKDDYIDPFDKNSPGYHTRCYIKNDYLYNADTTLNYRRQSYYQRLQALCPSNCGYNGIDIDGFLKCSCDGADSEIFYYFKEDYLPEIIDNNLNIVECPHLAFTSVRFY